jgi:hypothetical protein
MKYGDKKRGSHVKNTDVWQELSGKPRFSLKQEYWTLADPDSVEYESMDSLGILRSPSQYHFVNDDPSKIAVLKAKYGKQVPEQNFHCMDLCHAMLNSPCKHGGIVYIDSISEPDKKHPVASTMLISALRNCGPKTLVCMNMCYTRPECGNKILPIGTFLSNVDSGLSESYKNLWAEVRDQDGHYGFCPQKTGMTQMLTLFYWRDK